MSVLSAAEQDAIDVGPAGITVPGTEVRSGGLVSFGDLRTAGGLRSSQVYRGRLGGAWLHRGEPMLARPGKPGSRPAAGLRLTRRGRVVLAGFAIMVVTAVATAMLFWLSAAGGAQAVSHDQSAGTAHRGLSRVIVQPGQTLWSIARRAEPSADPRIVVQQIIEVNALGSPLIQPGELLWVPKG